jgi:hypothetical protein
MRPYSPNREADPVPAPLPEPDRREPFWNGYLVEGDEGGGTTWLSNKEYQPTKERKR